MFNKGQLAGLMKNSYAIKMLLRLLDERIGKPEQSLRNWHLL